MYHYTNAYFLRNISGQQKLVIENFQLKINKQPNESTSTLGENQFVQQLCFCFHLHYNVDQVSCRRTPVSFFFDTYSYHFKKTELLRKLNIAEDMAEYKKQYRQLISHPTPGVGN